MKLLPSDYIVLAAVLLLVGAHVTTNFLIKYYEDAAQQVGVAKEIVLVMESNPVARWFFGFEGFKRIYSFIVAPGLLMGMYWWLRKKYYQDQDVLQSFAVALFIMMSLDFLNDISLLFGVLY